jgi:hypothetical protein
MERGKWPIRGGVDGITLSEVFSEIVSYLEKGRLV